jgi:hypothetical protein
VWVDASPCFFSNLGLGANEHRQPVRACAGGVTRDKEAFRPACTKRPFRLILNGRQESNSGYWLGTCASARTVLGASKMHSM